jgi:hypothetical protein
MYNSPAVEIHVDAKLHVGELEKEILDEMVTDIKRGYQITEAGFKTYIYAELLKKFPTFRMGYIGRQQADVWGDDDGTVQAAAGLSTPKVHVAVDGVYGHDFKRIRVSSRDRESPIRSTLSHITPHMRKIAAQSFPRRADALHFLLSRPVLDFSAHYVPREKVGKRR